MNDKTPEETDYYVSYDAIVYAGIDFKDIVISVDSASKTINIGIPKVYITEIKVDISSFIIVAVVCYPALLPTLQLTSRVFSQTRQD